MHMIMKLHLEWYDKWYYANSVKPIYARVHDDIAYIADGHQEYNGIVYPGGGNQVQILNSSDRQRLIPIGAPVKIY